MDVFRPNGRASFQVQLCISEGRWLALTVKVVRKLKSRKVLHSRRNTDTTDCTNARLGIFFYLKKKSFSNYFENLRRKK